jgi:hypothetical protein
MKKLAFILGIVLMAGALVAVGWWLGFRQRYLTEAYAISTVDKHLTDASVKAAMLHQMDVGRFQDARNWLSLQLDGDILVVDSLIDSSDARSRELASKVFSRIAAFRAEYPSNYTAQMPEVDGKIADILRRSTEAPEKQKIAE